MLEGARRAGGWRLAGRSFASEIDGQTVTYQIASSAVPVKSAASLVGTQLVGEWIYTPGVANTLINAFDFGVVPPTGMILNVTVPAGAAGSLDMYGGGVLVGTAYPLRNTVSTMLPGQTARFRFDGAQWQTMLSAPAPTTFMGNLGTPGILAVGPAGSNSSAVSIGLSSGILTANETNVGHVSSGADIVATIPAGPGTHDISAIQVLPSNTLVKAQVAAPGIITNLISSIGTPGAGYKFKFCVLGGAGSVQLNHMAGGNEQIYIPGAAVKLTLVAGQWAEFDYDKINELGFGARVWVCMGTNGVVV